MKILIVAATIPEIAPIYAHFGLPEGHFTEGPDFDILITGVGMVSTAFALGNQISGGYKLILNLGIAGSFDPDIPLGTVLNVFQDQFSELGAEDRGRFIEIEELGFGKSRYSVQHNLLTDVLTPLRKVRGITVNCVHGTENSIEEIRTRLSPDVESMEGAAVLYAAEQAGIPCLQIRSISNYVEPRNRDSWKIGLAISKLSEWAIRFLTNR